MKNERNLGIDLLRILCMHMIVLHHVLDNCGISAGVEMFSVNYTIVCLMHGVNHCAINTYALISGYVYADSNYKISSIIKMWLQVLFYTTGFLILFAVLAPEMINRRTLLTSLFPMLTEHYWYFTQYVCMFFFIPVLNIILNVWNTEQFKRFFLVAFVLFSCVNVIVNTNLFNVDDGYSAIWLAVLYLIGGYIKKNPKHILWNRKKYILVYGGCVMLTAASRWMIQFATINILGKANNGGRLLIYTSPTMLFAAIALLIVFSDLKAEKLRKYIQFFTPLTFGAYIIHMNVFVSKGYLILHELMERFFTANSIIFVGIIILLTESIYIICSFIDFGRVKLFRLFRIGTFSEWLGKKFCVLKI